MDHRPLETALLAGAALSLAASTVTGTGAFSPDETARVADTGRTHDPAPPVEIVAWAMTDAGAVRRGTFARSEAGGLYDGFRVDRDGHRCTTLRRDVEVRAPSRTVLGRVAVPELVSTLACGARKRDRVYITAQTSLHALHVHQQPPGW